MFKCMQKHFNLLFPPPSFTLGSVHTPPDLQVLEFIWPHSIWSLLSQKKSTHYFLVWFVIGRPGKEQQLTEGRQSRGWGLEPGGEGEGTARQILLVYPARHPQQRGFFSARIKCVFCSSVLAEFNSVFPHYNFFQLLQSWSICAKKCTSNRFHYGSVLCSK